MVRVRPRDRTAATAGPDYRRLFEIADDPGASYGQKLAAYRELADGYFDTDRYHDFCATSLSRIDEIVLEWIASPEFDRLIIDTVRSAYPAHEHEEFTARLRGLLALWAADESGRLRAA